MICAAAADVERRQSDRARRPSTGCGRVSNDTVEERRKAFPGRSVVEEVAHAVDEPRRARVHGACKHGRALSAPCWLLRRPEKYTHARPEGVGSAGGPDPPRARIGVHFPLRGGGRDPPPTPPSRRVCVYFSGR